MGDWRELGKRDCWLTVGMVEDARSSLAIAVRSRPLRPVRGFQRGF